MTQDQFNALPPLLTRVQAVECGISERVIDTIALVLNGDSEEVPFGRLGAVPIGNGRKRKYRKRDVARMVGLKF